MASHGTKIYCPNCKDFTVCKAISPTKIGKPKARRWLVKDYSDISWFRRGRQCIVCSQKFISAEIDEKLIMELVELRKRLSKKQSSLVRSIGRKCSWLKREESIPLYVAELFIEDTAWWLTHSSGFPVRAPGHAERIYKSSHGWTIDFGANSFLVGKAIERCKDAINDILRDASHGKIPLKSEVTPLLKLMICGSVATKDGYEYVGFYPLEKDKLVFGAQAIDVMDGINFILNHTGVMELLLDL